MDALDEAKPCYIRNNKKIVHFSEKTPPSIKYLIVQGKSLSLYRENKSIYYLIFIHSLSDGCLLGFNEKSEVADSI